MNHDTAATATPATATHEAEALAVLDRHAAAHAARDVEALLSLYAPEAVLYTLAPPLQQEERSHRERAADLQEWFDTFDGPVQMTYRDPAVTAYGDVALVHCLTSMRATPTGTQDSFEFWLRSTFGLRRVDGDWLISHLHESTPFHMDGSFRAATDLRP